MIKKIEKLRNKKCNKNIIWYNNNGYKINISGIKGKLLYYPNSDLLHWYIGKNIYPMYIHQLESWKEIFEEIFEEYKQLDFSKTFTKERIEFYINNGEYNNLYMYVRLIGYSLKINEYPLFIDILHKILSDNE